MELTAACKVFKRDVRVFRLDGEAVLEYTIKAGKEKKKKKTSKGAALNIGFDGVGHYCGVVDPGSNSNSNKARRSRSAGPSPSPSSEADAEEEEEEEEEENTSPPPKSLKNIVENLYEDKKKPRPGAPCHCGSNRAYKRCCKKGEDFAKKSELKPRSSRSRREGGGEEEDEELDRRIGNITL